MFEMTRWDPFQEMMSLREAMNHLFEESMLPSRAIGSGQETGQLATRGTHMPGTPALDIQDQGDNFIVRASLPGVRPDDVRIEARGNQVMISGQTREEQEAERGNYLLRERRIGQFFRTFTLPTEVKTDSADASFENGILILRLPKSEQGTSRQIPIRGQQRLESGQAQMPGQGRTQGQSQMSGQGQVPGQPNWQGQGQQPTSGQQMPGQGQSQMPGQRPTQGQPPMQG
ncbi:MAG TPA: Hsp20 family protein [Ktedonobacterales bacterium]|jgi:HSP20 family protein